MLPAVRSSGAHACACNNSDGNRRRCAARNRLETCCLRPLPCPCGKQSTATGVVFPPAHGRCSAHQQGLGSCRRTGCPGAQEGRKLPLLVQVSQKHADRHGHREGAAVRALLSSGYQDLRTDATAPDRAEYLARFRGALVLAPYAREQFSSQVSGIVLDALLHGAPVIATKGTWPGDQVERFGAGITIAERTAAALATAIDRVLTDWATYSDRACAASSILAQEHDPIHLLQVMSGVASVRNR